jgi:hypothetical protein
VSTWRRLAPFALAAFALAAAVVEGSGSHAHALTEVDLAPHAVMSAGEPVDCGPLDHLESATPHRHAACGACALASTPSSAAAPVIVLAGGAASETGRGARELHARPAAHGARGPARAPPFP